MARDKLYVLNEVYLGIKRGFPHDGTLRLEVLVDRNKGGPMFPEPLITPSDNLRLATKKDLEKFPLSIGEQGEFYEVLE